MRRLILVLIGFFGAATAATMLIASASGFATVKQEPPSAMEALTLPRIVEGTTLIAQQVVSYDGAFFEDGTNAEVSNTAALLLHNAGHAGITSATVCVEQGLRKLTFVLTQLPSGGTVLVLERNRCSYSTEPVTACYGQMHSAEEGWEMDAYCALEPVDMGSVAITNTRGDTLKDLCLHYKAFYPEGGFYLGGITYAVVVEALEPGRRLLLFPEHYAGAYSAFVRIEAELPPLN